MTVSGSSGSSSPTRSPRATPRPASIPAARSTCIPQRCVGEAHDITRLVLPDEREAVRVALGAWSGRRVCPVERAAAPPAGPLGSVGRIHDPARHGRCQWRPRSSGTWPQNQAGSAAAWRLERSRSGSPLAARKRASRLSASSSASGCHAASGTGRPKVGQGRVVTRRILRCAPGRRARRCIAVSHMAYWGSPSCDASVEATADRLRQLVRPVGAEHPIGRDVEARDDRTRMRRLRRRPDTHPPRPGCSSSTSHGRCRSRYPAGLGSDATEPCRCIALGTRLGSSQADSPAVVVPMSTPRAHDRRHHLPRVTRMERRLREAVAGGQQQRRAEQQ